MKFMLTALLLSQSYISCIYAQDLKRQTIEEMIESTDAVGYNNIPCLQRENGLSQYACAERKLNHFQNECSKKYFPNHSVLKGKQLSSKIIEITSCPFMAEIEFFKDVEFPNMEMIKAQQSERLKLAKKFLQGEINESKFVTLEFRLKVIHTDERDRFGKSVNYVRPDFRDE